MRETAREFTDREIVPVARDNDREEKFDLELVRKLGDMGYLGPIVDEEYGGRGLDYRTYGLIVEEIGRGDSAMRTVVSTSVTQARSASRSTKCSKPPCSRLLSSRSRSVRVFHHLPERT